MNVPLKYVVLVSCTALAGAVAGLFLLVAICMPFSAEQGDILPGVVGVVLGAPGGALLATVAAIAWLLLVHDEILDGKRPADVCWNAGTRVGGLVGLGVGAAAAYWGIRDGQMSGEDAIHLFAVLSLGGAFLGGTIGTWIVNLTRRTTTSKEKESAQAKGR